MSCHSAWRHGHDHPGAHWRRYLMSRFGGRGGCGPRGAGGGRGPFGRGGPFGGRGRRMFDAGALRLVVLGLVAEAPRHGYDVIKALETRLGGAYSPSPGAIYPLLQMLEEADLVSSAAEGNKRLYTITEAGRAWLAENRAELDRINAQIDEAATEIRQSAVGEEIGELRRTLFGRLREGSMSPEEAERIRAILRRARDDIEGRGGA